MHNLKISNFTARHGWERMSRPQHDLSIAAPPTKRSLPAMISPNPSIPGHAINLSFNVPFSSNLAGPEKDDVIYSNPNAFQRWTHPEGAAEDTPNHALPVHTRNVEALRALCRQISESSGETIQATVTSSRPKPVPGMQRGPLTALVTNVCVSGDSEVVHKMRAKILMETPITMV